MKLLIVEDNAQDADLLKYSLRGLTSDIIWAQSREELAAVLENGHDAVDAVVIDYWLPGMGWPDSMEMARARYPDVPIIVVSGALPDDRGRDALAAGADDYVDKEHLQYLPHAINREIVKRRAQVARSAANTRLRELKPIDDDEY